MHDALNKLYDQFNRKELVHPDPLEFLYAYPDIRDREIAGLIASSLAYGRVTQILKSVSCVLDVMGPSPSSFLQNTSYLSLCREFKGFRHRFASGEHLAALLFGIKRIIKIHGSLNACFLKGYSKKDDTIIPAMTRFVHELVSDKHTPGHLIALPEKGSACKRMNLFLRWMVRCDDVDPGGWEGISPSQLIIPLDTHMHCIGLELGFTNSKQANMRTAIEITNEFKKLIPNDPVKYDFSLTRFGIRDDLDHTHFNDFKIYGYAKTPASNK